MKTLYDEKRFTDFREIVRDAAKNYGNKTAFICRANKDEKISISYLELKERYYRLCNYLLDNGLGGKRIAVIGKNCFEWVLSYLCAATVGVAVPIDKELSDKDIEDFLHAAECAAVCSEKPFACGNVNRQHYSFDDIRNISGSTYPIYKEKIDVLDIKKDKMQVLIFTSGTTGNAKGVCLSQYNICSDIHSTVSVVKITPKDTTLSILPLHHTYECTLDCLLLLSKGATITYADSLSRIASNMTEYQPSVLVVVPALLKFMNKRIKNAIVKECPTKYKEIYANKTLSEALKKTPLPVRLAIRQKVRKSLGGKLRLFIVGAADLDTSLVEDFSALGIRTLQGYGLTECAPLLAGNTDFYLNKASTGIAIPGVTLKIDRPNADGIGEIIAKGDNIMLGYYRDEEATNAVFRDGWFCTGDLGKMDADGALYIKGRIKNVIVTDNGKNIYPEELETRLFEHPEISESLVMSAISRGVTAVKAKILPNVDYIKEKLGRIPTASECAQIVEQVVNDVNAKIPTYKHITVIEHLTTALEKTTTQKIRRCGANLL